MFDHDSMHTKSITPKMALKLGQIRRNGTIIPISERLYMYSSESKYYRTCRLPVYNERRKKAMKINNNSTPIVNSSNITRKVYNNNLHRNNAKYYSSNSQNVKNSHNETCNVHKNEVIPQLLLTNIMNDEIPTMVEEISPLFSFESLRDESVHSGKYGIDYNENDKNIYRSVSGVLTCDLYQPSGFGTYYNDCHIEILINKKVPQNNNINTRSESFYKQQSSYETEKQSEFDERDILNLEDLNDDLNHSYLAKADHSNLDNYSHNMDSALDKIVPALLKKLLNI